MDIEYWKFKHKIDKLKNIKGDGTNMISLLIPPSDSISKYQKLLTNEFGAASNIKSRVNRLSVLSAITSTRQKLKLYNKVPPNGLVIYCGNKTIIDFEPLHPINTSQYMCDDHFHTEHLEILLEDRTKYGFIVIDGDGALYATLSGNNAEVIYKFSVNIPNKHNKGGQSAQRFGRINDAIRKDYTKKASEYSIKCFITNNIPNVKHIIIAGKAGFKNKLYDALDDRLKSIVIKIIDIQYGGNHGLNNAISLSSDILTDVTIISEISILRSYFELIYKGEQNICYGRSHTMYAFESGLIDKLIIWDELITDDIIENYQSYNYELHIVSDKSQEGLQFCKGFGGIGAILRYDFDFDNIDI